MDILLVNSPSRSLEKETIVLPPLGLGYLAAVAREKGHQVSILDGFGESLDWAAFEERLSGKRYDVIGLTGIRTVGYFILGIPTETYEQAEKTIQFAIDLKTGYAQFGLLSPLPGTRLYNDAVENNWYAEIAGQNVDDKSLKRPVVLAPNWDEEEMKSILKLAHRRFYLRPAYFLKTLMRVRSFRDLLNLIRPAFKLIKYVFRREHDNHNLGEVICQSPQVRTRKK